MTSEARRRRRLRLMVGIILGVFAGTVHALVSHVVARVDRDEAAMVSAPAAETDALAR